jgi:hypothetical protein
MTRPVELFTSTLVYTCTDYLLLSNASTECDEPVLLLPAMAGGGIEWRGRERSVSSLGQSVRSHLRSNQLCSQPILAVPLREQEQAATDSSRINYDSRRMPQPCDVLPPRHGRTDAAVMLAGLVVPTRPVTRTRLAAPYPPARRWGNGGYSLMSTAELTHEFIHDSTSMQAGTTNLARVLMKRRSTDD